MAASLTINFRRTGSSVPRDITLVIKDYCTDALLPGATVVITGPNGYQWQGLSSQTGEIYLSQLKPGQYNVRTTRDGYLPSDTDALANDFFTV